MTAGQPTVLLVCVHNAGRLQRAVGYLDVDDVRAADVVITMGCGDARPIFPGTRYQDWELEDPPGKDLATVRRIRDDIRSRVGSLLGELRATPATP
ncbi:MAG: hypothetical protein M3N46_13460 [Actinomycetota bacterium]|nr:hypothetical protein [Actinomycetota bacterium]